MFEENTYSDEQLMKLREKYSLPLEDEDSPVHRAADIIDKKRVDVRKSIDSLLLDITKYEENEEKKKRGEACAYYGKHFVDSLWSALSNRISRNERLNRDKKDVLNGAKSPSDILEDNRPTIESMIVEIVNKTVDKRFAERDRLSIRDRHHV